MSPNFGDKIRNTLNRPLHHTVMVFFKYDNGKVTLDLQKWENYIPLALCIFLLMFGDDFIHFGTVFPKDTKISWAMTISFIYSIIHLHHHFLPEKPKESSEPSEEPADKTFKHEDNKCKVLLELRKKEVKRIVYIGDTDEEASDDEGRPVRRRSKRTTYSTPPSVSSSANRTVNSSANRQREIIEKKLELKFISWSKHPNVWQLVYWLPFCKANTIETEESRDVFEF